MPYHEVPSTVGRFDVGVLPFARNRVTDAASPVKLFEFLAAGRGVVATDLPECRGVPGVRTARDACEFLEAVEATLAEAATGGPDLPADFLARHSWDARLDAVLEAL